MPGRWSWTDAAIFIAVISALQLAMFVLLTKVFCGMFPEGEQCPVCDEHTSAVERSGWWKLFARRFRRSWCLACGWEGVLRRSDAWMRESRRRDVRQALWRARFQRVWSMANRRSHSGQLPLSSKKSS